MNNNFFETREDEGRLKWLIINLNDILRGKKCVLFTHDPYAVFDFEMTATTTNTLSYGEIKTVHRPYTKYDTFQIDYNKVKSIQDKAREDGRRAYVVGFFSDYTIVWDITDISLEERKYKAFCTATTNNYSKGKKEKEEVWLSKDEAIWVKENITF